MNYVQDINSILW